MNSRAQNYRYATAVGAIVLMVIAVYFVLHKVAGEEGMNATSTATSSAVIDDAALATLSAGGTVKGNGYTITATHAKSAIAPPDFNKPLVFTTDLTADARAILQSKWQIAYDTLKKDPYDPEMWIALGALRKIAGDYKSAASAWEYASLLSPKNSISFNNLGDLYMNYLHNYALAEKSYLTAISNEASNPFFYASLATMYENFYKKGTGADEAILIKGIKANPKSIDLQVLLARLYTREGKTALAKAAFQAAISSATSQNKPDIAAQLKTEAGL